MRARTGLIALMAACATAGCSQDRGLDATVASHEAALREMPRTFYRPGLGDMMHALQLRHAKLWFAGDAQNWELAAFEVHEIEETLERVAIWHANHEDISMAPAIKAYGESRLYAIEQAIANTDRTAFVTAFDQFTSGCNECHRAAKHGFIVIQRPQSDPYGNQRWVVE